MYIHTHGRSAIHLHTCSFRPGIAGRIDETQAYWASYVYYQPIKYMVNILAAHRNFVEYWVGRFKVAAKYAYRDSSAASSIYVCDLGMCCKHQEITQHWHRMTR